MRQVTPYNLWIGHRGDLRDLRPIHQAGISLLVDVAINEAPPAVNRELAYARFPLTDGVGNEAWLIRGAVRTTADALRAGESVMVACSMGLSRSPAIAAASLSVGFGLPPADAICVVSQGGADISRALWDHILRVLVDMPPSAAPPQSLP